MMIQPKDFRLGATQATMFPLRWHELPDPIADSYKPYAVVKICGGMTAKGYGFPSTVWTFSSLSQDDIAQILSLFDNPDDASVTVYIRTYINTGGVRETADFSAIMYMPVDGAGMALVPDSAFNWVNIQLRFAHLVEL